MNAELFMLMESYYHIKSSYIVKEPLIKFPLPFRLEIWYNSSIKNNGGADKMKQETFTDIEYSFRKKKTKREEFLEIMDEIIPWEEWVDVVKPYYPVGKRGRPPHGD